METLTDRLTCQTEKGPVIGLQLDSRSLSMERGELGFQDVNKKSKV